MISSYDWCFHFPFIQRVPRGLHLRTNGLFVQRQFFASACTTGIASLRPPVGKFLCALPQRVPRGLHRANGLQETLMLFFASACTTGIASIQDQFVKLKVCLCLSVYHGDCISHPHSLFSLHRHFASACTTGIASTACGL